MNDKRKKAEEMILKTVELMEPKGTNRDRYKAIFSKMNDKEFDKFIGEVVDGTRKLDFYAPNMQVVLRQEDLFKAADYIGAEIFSRITFTDPVTKLKYTPEPECLVLDLPIRRVRQYLQHGISVPESDRRIDSMTGQVMKPDQSSKCSFVEMQILYGRGMTETIKEFMKVRGGDIHAYTSFKQSCEETGSFRQSSLDENTLVRSTLITSLILKCMGLDNNFVDSPEDIQAAKDKAQAAMATM